MAACLSGFYLLRLKKTFPDKIDTFIEIRGEFFIFRAAEVYEGLCFEWCGNGKNEKPYSPLLE